MQFIKKFEKHKKFKFLNELHFLSFNKYNFETVYRYIIFTKENVDDIHVSTFIKDYICSEFTSRFLKGIIFK